MTLHEQSIADDRMRVEIAKPISETSEIKQILKYRLCVFMAVYVSAMGIRFKFF